MNRRPSARPWYREFWPWFIIALIGSVVIASMVTIFLALKYNDEPAAGEYRKQGLGIVSEPPPTPQEPQ